MPSKNLQFKFFLKAFHYKLFQLMLFLSIALESNAQTSLCIGSTNQASYVGTGGTWVSSNTSVATVNSSGLVTGVAPGTATVSYQTVSPSTNSLFWNFETGATEDDDDIWKYNPTTTSNPSSLTGFMTQTDDGDWENFGPGPGMVLEQDNLSPNNGPYIEFNASAATTLSNVTFTAYHQHNPANDDGAGPSYVVKLQLSVSGGPWTDIGNSFTCTAATSGTQRSINLNNTSVPAGTHRLRWVRTNGSTQNDYFALNNVTFSSASSTPTTVYSQNYLVLASPEITAQPSTVVQNVCQNGATAVRSVTATGPGLTYQWYVNTVNNNTSGTLISGATLASFTPPSSVVGTFYYYCIVSGTCSPAASSSVFRVNVTASVSNAGPDQIGASACGLTSISLAGNASPGTGVWSVISGTGGTITTPSSPSSNFSGVAGNSYTLRWTVTNGGCVATDDVVITFNTIPGNAVLSATSIDAEVLIVGGGGGGSARAGGGGGGGQVIATTSSISAANSVAITVGAGGAGGQNGVTPSSAIVAPNTIAYGVNSGGHGGTSSFGSINALGGAGGPVLVSSRAGGNSLSPTNVVRVGGSPSWNSNGNNNAFSGGGGAGSGGNGGNSSPTGATTSSATAGSGGFGISSSISGTAVTYGGGGGGGCSNNATARGTGTDGGGNGGRGNSIGDPGAANRGGGGGGSGFNGGQNPAAGNGGSGVVIVRYLGTQQATGGTITQAGGYTIHTFTTSGTFAANGTTPSAIVPNQSRCGEGTVTLSSTTNAGFTLDWYDAATGGTLLSSGTTSYTTPIISSSTTYYVSVRNTTTGCISANRLAVTATITGASTISSNQSICAGTTPTNIVATSTGSTFQWQSSADNVTFTNVSGQTNGTLTGATIGNLLSTRYYRAIVTNGSCVTNSTVHTITVSDLTLPTTPVTGSIIWRGNTSNDWMTLANWNQFNGANYVPVDELPITTSNVIIPFTSACIANQPNIFGNTVNVNNLTIENGASLSATAGTININGNWLNNGIFNRGTGLVNFNGNTAQSIGGNNTTLFHNLTLNKTSGALTLSKPTSIENTFTMTTGNIVTSANNLLTIGTSTTSVGSIDWTDGSVLGPLQRYYSANANGTMQSGIFPVGTSTNNRYARINYTSNPNIGGTITAEYIAGICPIGYQGLPATINNQFINNYENEGYWSIDPSGGNLNTARYKLVLRGKNLSTVSELESLRIIKSSNHLAWNDNIVGNGIHTAVVGSVNDFTIASNNMVGFSWFNIGSGNSNPLPIELIKFEANCGQSSVMINWATSSEQNSEKFIIEKSRDLINWQQVSQKSAAGNSNYLIEYLQEDTSPLAGTSYYQLRQIDFNGDESKFGPVSVTCNSIEGNYILYPNPTTGSFNVEISNIEQETINCTIVDLSGKVVYQVEHALNQGTTLLNFDNLQLQKGSYIFQIIGDKNSWRNQLFNVD